eukprot:CAMPEP_0184650180 /NCGR_PEP_ID=MMETSP0308-20130426/7702_1 /TAXON_ID=38269 /ORGANISM="Gloeochaete witrockiana, Strain SAG 46.84" /LENGTH=46 /DNA_ID= /DNA_START= /DNA_END= /DNA_ORIENTATION=
MAKPSRLVMVRKSMARIKHVLSDRIKLYEASKAQYITEQMSQGTAV